MTTPLRAFWADYNETHIFNPNIRTTLADAPALDPTDPTAKALGYITKSIKPDSKCGNCAQFQGKAADAHGAVHDFPGQERRFDRVVYELGEKACLNR